MKPLLVVDDSKTFGSLLVRTLKARTGHPCVWARSMAECRAALDSGPGFAAALLDLNLPDAPDGEVVDLVLSRGVPSAVFTGELSEELRARIWSKGIVDYVLKEGMHAVDYVARLVKRLVRNAGMRALVVDDSDLSLRRASFLLSAHGYAVRQAGGMREALDILAREPGIRLVVTDYHMPDGTGAELTMAIRRTRGLDEVAVIGMSAEGDRSTPVALLKSGANDFVSKPILAEEFYCRVSQNVDMLNQIEDIAEMARRDHLTGLNNRKHLFEAGAGLLERARRAGQGLAAAIMDIDHFKKVNDTHGHDAGDEVLRHFASLMRRHFPEGHLLARFGGEEFCVLAPGVHPGEAFGHFDAFRALVEAETARHGGLAIPCTVSIGVFTGQAQGFEELVKAADELLYRSKREGRNRVTMA